VLWGVIADRIAARWPVHEDGAVRPIDWRTPVVAVVGGLAGALLLDRFGGVYWLQLAIMAVWILALVLAFATDLDQRLLPDVITYSLVALALLAFATGVGPYVHTLEDLGWAALAAVAIPAVLYLLSIPFGKGAIGQGDLKLLFGFGLLAGPFGLFLALVAGAIAAAAVILVLVVLRRITLKTYVPYGPFLIIGAVWALLAAT
jgi:leader peptidase (prepilin peptidase)/N-methyltransferase